jgi:predicted aspartyl protease
VRYDRFMRRATVLALTLSVWLAALPQPGRAEIYKYTDERGQNSYVEGLESVPERYRAVAVPLGLRNLPAPTPSKDTAATARPSGTALIKYTPGQRIMVDVKINGGFTTQLLLDTGADRTLISPRVLTAAGVPITKTVATGSITGATGTDKISYVVVDSLEVGEAKVGKMPVGSYELAGSGTGDGLLGRDFLDQFKMTVDAAKGEVTLAPK